jgi:molybdenum cofactor cytidylyltransferase
LAAGLSSRMGQPKLELDLHGISVLGRVLRAALDSALDRVILVQSPDPANLLQGLGDQPVDPRLRRVVNEMPERGMSSSLAAGMAEVSPRSAGVMIILGDQPLITALVIDELVESFKQHRDHIVVPLVAGRRSNPVIFPQDLFAELTAGQGDVGGRHVLQRNAARTVGIEMGTFYDDSDVDTPRDLETVRELLAKARMES